MNLKKNKQVCQVEDCGLSRASTASLSSIESWESCTDANDVVRLNTIVIKKKKQKKRVRFGSLEIHEHAIELGGSSLPGSGPSMTLAWKEQECFKIRSVEVFENTRPFETMRGSELLQTESERIHMLLDAGHALEEINKSIEENNLLRKQRRETLKKQRTLLSRVFGQ